VTLQTPPSRNKVTQHTTTNHNNHSNKNPKAKPTTGNKSPPSKMVLTAAVQRLCSIPPLRDYHNQQVIQQTTNTASKHGTNNKHNPEARTEPNANRKHEPNRTREHEPNPDRAQFAVDKLAMTTLAQDKDASSHHR
jgi:hypothetical protein